MVDDAASRTEQEPKDVCNIFLKVEMKRVNHADGLPSIHVARC